MSEFCAAAVDLGASSGRIVVGRVAPDQLEVDVVHRFPNEPIDTGHRLVWNLAGFMDGIADGLAAAIKAGHELASVAIDSWAVDYGLLDDVGRLLAPPVHYRDSRTDGVMARVRDELGDDHLYKITGLQFLPFNTLYQLLSESPQRLNRAATMLLIPDLITQILTGSAGAERTNASTTQLYDVSRGQWATDLVEEVGLPARILPPIHDAGDVRGVLRPSWRRRVGDGGRIQVRATASHDTAAAVAAVPAVGERFAYISCGTWSLVGVELDAPVLAPESMAANFTNEVGVDGTIRYLRNAMGLWPLQECLREWEAVGGAPSLNVLLRDAAREPALRSVIDPESPELVPPGNMATRIRQLCAASGQPEPKTDAALVRCILDSLAIGHARTIRDAVRLSGQPVDAVHMVGGGARNQLLAQLTADACGLPVLAGPVEATAIGNLLVQARAAGVLGSQREARALVAATQEVERFEPCGELDWSAWL